MLIKYCNKKIYADARSAPDTLPTRLQWAVVSHHDAGPGTAVSVGPK